MASLHISGPYNAGQHVFMFHPRAAKMRSGQLLPRGPSCMTSGRCSVAGTEGEAAGSAGSSTGSQVWRHSPELSSQQSTERGMGEHDTGIIPTWLFSRTVPLIPASIQNPRSAVHVPSRTLLNLVVSGQKDWSKMMRQRITCAAGRNGSQFAYISGRHAVLTPAAGSGPPRAEARHARRSLRSHCRRRGSSCAPAGCHLGYA